MGVRTTRSGPLPNQVTPSLLAAIGRVGSRPSWRSTSACWAAMGLPDLSALSDLAALPRWSAGLAAFGFWRVCALGLGMRPARHLLWKTVAPSWCRCAAAGPPGRFKPMRPVPQAVTLEPGDYLQPDEKVLLAVRPRMASL